MQLKSISVLSFTLAIAGGLAACGGGGGGGGGGGSSTVTGYFKDSAVSGLGYSCAPSGQAGTTGTGGSFSYVDGDTCTFSLGAVELGSATAGEVVTPVELVSGGTPSDPTVINIVQLLTTADDDGDPTNGINIPTAVSTAAESATGVNVSSGTFDTDIGVVQLVNDMYAAGSYSSILTDATTAQNHIEATASCVYSGMYRGTYSPSTGTGEWGMIVFPDGTARAVSGDNSGYGEYTGTFNASTKSISVSGTWYDIDPLDGVTILSTTPSSATGTISNPQTVTGTADGGAVSFSGTRFGGSATAKYRFTGYYSGDGSGVFAADVDGSNNVTGQSYSFDDGSTYSLGGNVSGSTLTITVAGGTAQATVNLATGALSGGTWSANGGVGTFSGSGCQLN